MHYLALPISFSVQIIYRIVLRRSWNISVDPVTKCLSKGSLQYFFNNNNFGFVFTRASRDGKSLNNLFIKLQRILLLHAWGKIYVGDISIVYGRGAGSVQDGSD